MPLVLTDKSVANMTQEQLLLQCVKEYANPSNHETYEKDLGGGRIVDIMPAIATGKGCHARRTLEAYEKRIKLQDVSPKEELMLLQHASLTPLEQVLLLQHKTLGLLIDSPDFESLDTVMQDEIISTYERGKKWF